MDISEIEAPRALELDQILVLGPAGNVHTLPRIFQGIYKDLEILKAAPGPVCNGCLVNRQFITAPSGPNDQNKQGKNFKKKPMIDNKFCFLADYQNERNFCYLKSPFVLLKFSFHCFGVCQLQLIQFEFPWDQLKLYIVLQSNSFNHNHHNYLEVWSKAVKILSVL